MRIYQTDNLASCLSNMICRISSVTELKLIKVDSLWTHNILFIRYLVNGSDAISNPKYSPAEKLREEKSKSRMLPHYHSCESCGRKEIRGLSRGTFEE